MYYQQRTVSKHISCSGIGLHSGKKVNLIIKPASINHGIRFVRVDILEKPEISAHFDNVVDTSLATVIGDNGYTVSTIEHLMASFAGMCIDNALVEVDSYELPIMDGSAKPYTDLIYNAGVKVQGGVKVFLLLDKPIRLSEDDKSVTMYPRFGYKITCTIKYDHPLIAKQTYSFDFDKHSFQDEISPARTFGFFSEVETMKRYGLAQGGSLKNAIVVGNDKIINDDGLRYHDEFVRHKILDCIGDFSLLKVPILGHIVTVKSGHKFNLAFLRKVFSEKSLWKTCVF